MQGNPDREARRQCAIPPCSETVGGPLEFERSGRRMPGMVDVVAGGAAS
jgi:hypothetical protein